MYVWYGKFSCKIRVLTHILEVTAAERAPVHVNARSENHILLPEARLFTDCRTILTGNIPVPCGCKTGQSRESHAGVIVPARISPVVPWNFRTDSVRAVACPQLRNTKLLHAGKRECGLSMNCSNLLIQRHPAERILHPGLDIG